VLSEGETQYGGYYSFNGDWMPEQHEGIQWLTNFDDTDTNASRLK
jgi:hypothetical protein